ncbi:CpsD/CapB family tyrosine-protein kinase [Bacillus sp. AFS041924]|uniref:CpsD/CapB family tyrosine-protein kinase n=1 Tax=Bacillus sp. AFS041924 TaxID=2033503 RepID=UPI000BFE1BAE|nr:CpsD/CapB family tyrosine-protein kinase [Bacillus sp. AFS041924]PGS52665.1 tyrosine protein kinase [Bacillus sp. AFS041924]
MGIVNKRLSHSTKPLNIVTATYKNSKISEEYRTVRTNFLSSINIQEHQALIITSPNQGEGKSTTIANFAISLAHSGKKVLLIDANLRRPTLHTTFNASNYVGLSSVLLGKTVLEDIVIETEISGLKLLPGGPVPYSPADLLELPTMKNLINKVTGEYDVVLIDSPPALEFADAKIIASNCDGLILVAQWGKTKNKEIVFAQRKLLNSIKILGVIINEKK